MPTPSSSILRHPEVGPSAPSSPPFTERRRGPSSLPGDPAEDRGDRLLPLPPPPQSPCPAPLAEHPRQRSPPDRIASLSCRSVGLTLSADATWLAVRQSMTVSLGGR